MDVNFCSACSPADARLVVAFHLQAFGVSQQTIQPTVFAVRFGESLWRLHGLTCDGVNPGRPEFEFPLLRQRNLAPAFAYYLRRRFKPAPLVVNVVYLLNDCDGIDSARPAVRLCVRYAGRDGGIEGRFGDWGVAGQGGVEERLR